MLPSWKTHPIFRLLFLPHVRGDDDNLLVYSITSSEPVSAPTPVKLPIVQVYSRRKPPNSYPAHVPSSLDLVPGNDLPIALHKGKHLCTYLISSFISYNCLSSSSCSFIVSCDSISIPKIVHEAISHLGWHNAIIEEMNALDDNGTWNLVDLLSRKRAIGCKWVFTVKVNLDGSVARLKARLVAKEYS